ncbi:mycothiol transferase [Georgenia deserti]|uniref:DinB family protein n=1 Tax=Georgenia deserti TaxID=2093781 RepID=A0ABW4L5U0_9MICO
MNVAALLVEAYSRVPDSAARVLDGLDLDALTYRPDPQANSISWLIWHLARGQDAQVADVAGTEQAWTADGWAERMALPFDDWDTGYGHTSDQVAQVRMGAEDLLGYLEDVHRRTVQYLTTLTEADLDEVIDESWDPPVTRGVRLVSVVDDDVAHLGQAAYLRGLIERM